jgi:hypothetical protein
VRRIVRAISVAFALTISLVLHVGPVGSASARSFTPLPTSPIGRHEHPRIWLTQATLPNLRVKLSGPFRPEYQRFVSSLDSMFGAVETLPSASSQILNYAFVYRIGVVPGIGYAHSPAEYGAKAKARGRRHIGRRWRTTGCTTP